MRFASAGLVAVAALLPATAAAQTSAQRPQIPLGLDLYRHVPDDNPLTRAKVALGRALFFDSLLSADRSLACASCHQPRQAFTDGGAVSVGVFGRRGTRSVPTLVNRTYGASFFWDGRTTSLETQVLMPIQDPSEMAMTVDELVERLNRHPEYPQLFRTAFGRALNREDLARALASYVRTILSGDAPIDRYMAGEFDALSEEAREGLRLFRGKANCTACHLGPNFTDERFHNTGIAWRDGVLSDSGRYVVTRTEEHLGAFKTPTLREIGRTAPYMHDGSIATLEEVIALYDRGGNPNPYRDPVLHPLHLSGAERAALLAFLRSLSGTIREGGPR
ncbi:MAG: cytochrome c peroxidase [Gemmatimonadales bacterium]